MNLKRVLIAKTIVPVIALIFALASFTSAQTTGKTPTGKPSGIFIALSVADVDSLSKWYQEKLGFTVLKSGEAPNKIAKFALLQNEAGVIELIQHREAKTLAEAAPSIKAAFQLHGIFKVGMVVENLDQLYASMKERQVQIAYDIMAAKDVPMRSFTIRDGEGNMLQFFGK
jgi:hypothetical protein